MFPSMKISQRQQRVLKTSQPAVTRTIHNLENVPGLPPFYKKQKRDETDT